MRCFQRGLEKKKKEKKWKVGFEESKEKRELGGERKKEKQGKKT